MTKKNPAPKTAPKNENKGPFYKRTEDKKEGK
jgi:hypothetical protein